MVMLTIPWIIDNMILHRDEQIKSRQPSEIEMRARKSFQQLTVPDWYKNKCRASPKIISDRRPIESRPAPWKDGKLNQARFNNPYRMNVAANEEGVTVMPVMGKIAKPSPCPESEILNESVKLPTANSKTHISKTFPKMSPSRKVQNINLVFPPTATARPETPKKDDMKNSIESINSLSGFTPTKMSSIKVQEPSVCLMEQKESSSLRSPISRKVGKVPIANCPPAEKTIPEKFKHTGKIRSEKWLNDIEKILTSPGAEREEELEERTDFPKDDESSAENQSRFFVSPRKSTEMEKIIKSQKVRSPGKSFVEEIIHELNAKCCQDPRKMTSSYVSPASKNFVKKLVEALERKEEDKTRDEDRCTAISVKDSDSDSDSKASFLRDASPFRSFSRALQESRGKISREAVTPYVDDDDESVYWIPLPTCKLPRTSSLKNVTTALNSAPEVGSESRFYPPSTSGQNGWGRTFDGRRIATSRQLFRIDETTVFDSGYSERSGTDSSASSLATDESWYYNEDETTRTASEVSDLSDDNGGCSSHTSITDYRMQRSTLV